MLDAATIEEGVLGLEGIHTANGFSLVGPFADLPRARLRRIAGLHSKELEDASMPNTGRLGETALPSLQRGKTVTYEGELEAKTLPSLRELTNAMRGAFREGTEYEFVVSPPATRGGVAHAYVGRVLQMLVDDEQRHGPGRLPSPHKRAFVLAVKQYDPRYFVTTLVEDDGNAAGTVVTLTNEGTAPAEPVFEFPGDAGLDQAEVRNQTTDKKLLFTGLTGLVPAGETLRIDFARREAYNVDTGADLSGRMDVELSDWWDEDEPGLIPGANNIWGGGTGTSTWGVSFRHANY